MARRDTEHSAGGARERRQVLGTRIGGLVGVTREMVHKRVSVAQDGCGVGRRGHAVLESPIERAEENALGMAQGATIFVGKLDAVLEDRGEERFLGL